MIISFFLSVLLFCMMEPVKKGIEAWMKAVILWVAFVFYSLEVMSLFSMVTEGGLMIFWGCLIGLLTGTIFFLYKKKDFSLKRQLKRTFQKMWHHKLFMFFSFYLTVLSILTIPYNWDSMSYHLSRIANWAQNQSVAHYATHNIRELASPMLAEFINLHVYILSGRKDYGFNLLQCFSALISAWIIYEIALKIGCRKGYATLAPFLFLTMPSVFGEALATQVDLFAGMWLLIFVYYYLDLIHMKCHLSWNRETRGHCVIMASCVAFGYLAKPSVLIGMFLLLVFLLVICIRRKDAPIEIGKLVFLVIPVIGIIVFPEVLRNVVSFSSITHPIAGQRQLIGTWKPFYVLVNGLKNFVFNFPNIYLPQSSHWPAAVVYRIAAVLKVNIDDSSISEDGQSFYLHVPQTYEPDMAINPVFLCSFIVCLLWAILRFKKQERTVGRTYFFFGAFIFLIFCCLVRWEPFVSRYMISYMALLCPAIIYEMQDFEKVFSSRNFAAWPAGIVFFMCCVELIGLGTYHMGIVAEENGDRFKGYFYNQKEAYADYDEVCDLVIEHDMKNVGLIISGSSYEYPIWQRLEGYTESIMHVSVENESMKYEREDLCPDCVITTRDRGEKLLLRGKTYTRLLQCTDNEYLYLYIINSSSVNE